MNPTADVIEQKAKQENNNLFPYILCENLMSVYILSRESSTECQIYSR